MSQKPYTKFPTTEIDRKDFVVVPRNSHGLAVWGPYQLLEPGQYDVVFDIEPLEFERHEQSCCRIDVAADSGKEILFERNFSVGELFDRGCSVRTTFDLNKTALLEYRVGGTGHSSFRIGYNRRAHPVELRGQLLPLDKNAVYAGNIDRIILLERGGIDFAMDSDELIARVDGLVLEVRNAEDLQLLHEIFLIKEYNVVPPGRSIAIDIGMNVGVASLALARNSQVETVYAYEPFAAPFRRAARHFQRNSKLSAKIQPENFGLADRDDDRDVKSNSGATIGTSIRGTKSGDPERIRIRDAANELGPKIEEAVRRGLRVVVKVDCEGSEFAIFESLKRASLFDKIDAFMIEWHKWWSPEMTQADLIAPLSEAGFFVFDRTNPLNPHAGFMLAVRSARV